MCVWKGICKVAANKNTELSDNGQHSKWSIISVGVSQGSILGQLLFLIYINNLIDNLGSNPKPFVDYTSLFLVAYDINHFELN